MMATRDRGMIVRETPMFSRPVRVTDIPDDGMELSIEADQTECSRIAEAIDLAAIEALSARYRLSRQSGGRVYVAGDVTARITRICVVSLEPFESEIVSAVDVTFAPVEPVGLDPSRSGQRSGAARRRDPPLRETAPPAAFDDIDPPDPIVDDRIDIGAIAFEFLVLALDPYPKKPGVDFSDVVVGETGEPAPSAFAALGRFKDRS